jgi:adenosine deaminase
MTGTGLLSTPHAGEIAPAPGQGAASVAGALNALHADRIAHGVLAASDPELVTRLANEQVCLDVCPSSNLNLSVYPSLAEHPLPALLAAGVPCSIGSDDPLLFGPGLLEEYELCRHEMGLDDLQFSRLAKASFQHSGAPADLREAGVLAADEWLVSQTETAWS